MMVLGRRALARPAIIGITVACAALIGGGAWVVMRPGPPKDNIIIVAIDTTRADSFGCYGSKRGVTPNLDKLAAEGVRFDQAFGHAPWTLPSIASLLTSTYPTTHGALGKQWGLGGGLETHPTQSGSWPWRKRVYGRGMNWRFTLTRIISGTARSGTNIAVAKSSSMASTPTVKDHE